MASALASARAEVHLETKKDWIQPPTVVRARQRCEFLRGGAAKQHAVGTLWVLMNLSEREQALAGPLKKIRSLSTNTNSHKLIRTFHSGSHNVPHPPAAAPRVTGRRIPEGFHCLERRRARTGARVVLPRSRMGGKVGPGGKYRSLHATLSNDSTWLAGRDPRKRWPTRPSHYVVGASSQRGWDRVVHQQSGRRLANIDSSRQNADLGTPDVARRKNC